MFSSFYVKTYLKKSRGKTSNTKDDKAIDVNGKHTVETHDVNGNIINNIKKLQKCE
jgi:hypothetical protein